VKSSASFSYEGSKGPAHWGDLSADWTKCGTGNKQSPISFTDAHSVKNNENGLKLYWSRMNSPNTLINNGHTWEVDAETSGNYVMYKNTRYDMLQWHFHSPSEHHHRGKYWAMEGHFVHQNEESGDLLVVGVLFETEGNNEKHAWLSNYWRYFADEESELEVDVTIPFNDFVAGLNTNSYWTYTGSLTTPPCTEGVTFVILKGSEKLTPEEVASLNGAVGFNARFTQEVNGRTA